MKQFIVVGLGNFGFNVANALSELGHDVLAIDSNSKKIEEIKERVSQAIVADAKDKKVLSEFISESIDAVIVGLGDNVESSTLAVLYLKDLGVKRIIAKAMDDDHGEILKSVGANEIIYPEKESAIRLAERLTTPNLIEHIPLAEGYSIAEIACPDKFIGKTLKELQLRNRYDVEVIAVKEVLLDKFYLIPKAEFKIGADIALIVIGKKEDIERLKL